ncbi:hypothetical protein H0H92_005401 [Tricholoma furcatifolium]|nr:hypothetical protein H0H92_005401 [Tricholoma furcatifolium]
MDIELLARAMRNTAPNDDGEGRWGLSVGLSKRIGGVVKEDGVDVVAEEEGAGSSRGGEGRGGERLICEEEDRVGAGAGAGGEMGVVGVEVAARDGCGMTMQDQDQDWDPDQDQDWQWESYHLSITNTRMLPALALNSHPQTYGSKQDYIPAPSPSRRPPTLRRSTSAIEPEVYHTIDSSTPIAALNAVLNVTQCHLHDIVNIAFNIVIVVLLNADNYEIAFRQLTEHVCALVYLLLHCPRSEDEDFVANVKELCDTLVNILEYVKAHCNGDKLSPGMRAHNPIVGFHARLENFLVAFGLDQSSAGTTQNTAVIPAAPPGRRAGPNLFPALPVVIPPEFPCASSLAKAVFDFPNTSAHYSVPSEPSSSSGSGFTFHAEGLGASTFPRSDINPERHVPEHAPHPGSSHSEPGIIRNLPFGIMIAGTASGITNVYYFHINTNSGNVTIVNTLDSHNDNSQMRVDDRPTFSFERLHRRLHLWGLSL